MTTRLAPSVPDVFHEALDREPDLTLVQAVLAWPVSGTPLQPRDCEQISLRLADRARVLVEDLRRRCAGLPEASAPRTLTEIVLGEAERRLSTAPRATVAGVQNRARLVRALHERLDHLHTTARPDLTAEVAG